MGARGVELDAEELGRGARFTRHREDNVGRSRVTDVWGEWPSNATPN